MIHLFTYGSLMCTDIMFSVADTRLKHSAAILEDFFRSKIRDEEYPGIIPQRNSRVSGVLYFDLPSTALHRLDVFEGEFYIRQDVQVMTEKHGPFQAMTYVVKPQYRDILTNKEWSYEHFLARGKTTFLQAYFGFEDIAKSAG